MHASELELAGERFSFVVEDVADDDFRAFSREQPRLGRALATCPAADECHLAVESSHGRVVYQAGPDRTRGHAIMSG